MNACSVFVDVKYRVCYTCGVIVKGVIHVKKLLAMLLLLAMIVPGAAAEKQPIPGIFAFTQEKQPREELRGNFYIQRTYPVTTNQQVNEEMHAVVDSLAEKSRAYIPTGKAQKDKSYMRVGASVSRTGKSWMSFLTVAAIKHEYEQVHVDYDARVYDLATGKPLTMADLFANDSQGWEIMARAVRAQLQDYFPQNDCEEEKLAQLCSYEQLQHTPFTLTGGSLRLHFRADSLYPGRNTLMHVRILYSDIRPHMLEEAQHQTDNSAYKLAALTFDDGPAHFASISTVETLMKHGADATFFLVGNMMAKGHYVMAYEHDLGYPLAYHSYEHMTEGLGIDTCIPAEWEKFSLEIGEITGKVPSIMRAPGGNEAPFIQMKIGLPLIHWSVSAGDGTGNRAYDANDRRIIAGNVGIGAQDGAVILMHDLRPACYQYLDLALEKLEERGFLCVTVEELFDAYGVKLQPNIRYNGAEDYVP